MSQTSNIAKDCIRLISEKLSKEISSEEYDERLKELAVKYPWLDFGVMMGREKKEEKPRVDRKSIAAGERESKE